jgi:uncharacterized CHY-type Zn-finger protein
MIKIEEVTKSYYNCSQCFDEFKQSENPVKLYNIIIGNDQSGISTRLCEHCLKQLRDMINEL